MNNYELEYSLIPRVIDECTRPEDAEYLFPDPKPFIIMTAFFSRKGSFDKAMCYPFKNLQFKYKETDDYQQVLITFPEPTHEPEAYCGLIVKYKGKQPAYFTWESTAEQGGFIGKPETGQHRNLGHIDKDLTADEFISKVHEIITSRDHLLKEEVAGESNLK